jgi:hypothetical protein
MYTNNQTNKNKGIIMARHVLTEEERSRGRKNGKRGKSAATYGKELIKSFIAINDPQERAELLKTYSNLPSGMVLPKEIHFQLFEMHQTADRRLADSLLADEAKQESALELLERKESIANRKLVLSKQLNQMNESQKEALYNQTVNDMREEIRQELLAELGLE